MALRILKVEEMLDSIGVKLNGSNPWDIQVHDKRFVNRVVRDQSLGAGESYMDGWWDCQQLDELFYRICRKKLPYQFYSPLKIAQINLVNSLVNKQSRDKATEVSNRHYNLGNRLYELMLGKSMAYTCGYWKDAKTLDEAEFAKYDLVCKKLYLKPGERILDIGCGWGGLAKYMAENYGVEVVAIDISHQPALYAQKHSKGLPVAVFNCDYRDLHLYNPKMLKFDKIASVGVLEHVGHKNYSTLMELSKMQLKDEGLFLLHSIGGNTSTTYCDPWINDYIFPNGHLPSLKQMGAAFEDRFIVEDLHNFGSYYENTLKGWYKNLNDNWSELKSSYDERFHRMMNYYLMTCAGAFRARDMQLWQFVLSPEGVSNGYISIR